MRQGRSLRGRGAALGVAGLIAAGGQAGGVTFDSAFTLLGTGGSEQVNAVAVPSPAGMQAINATTVGTYPPLSPNGFNYYQPPGNYTFTWDFTANSAISVTQLGYYNSALSGLANPEGFGSHLVTLMDLTAETTLASALVTASNPATGLFNYAPVAPVTLNTDDTYRISGTMTTQYYLVGLNQSAAPTAPQINYIYTPGDIFGSLPPPGTYADFGPNFIFQAASTCTENHAGRNIVALTGDSCVAAPGAYNPTTTTVPLPVAYNGFGFFANGGAIASPGDVSITTTDPIGTGGSHAVWAYGPGSQITFQGQTTISTTGNGSHGLYATGGGSIVAGAVDATASGTGSNAVYASGAGSRIALTGGGTLGVTGQDASVVRADNGGLVEIGANLVSTTLSVSGQARYALYAIGANSQINAAGLAIDVSTPMGDPVYADQGAVIRVAGGSVSTSERFAVNVSAVNGASVSVNGASLAATGDGSETLYAGNGGRVDAFNVNIVASGGIDEATGAAAGGLADSGRSGSTSTGGVLNFTSSSLNVTGPSAYGVFTADGGVTTLFSASLAVNGANAVGVQSAAGGQTAIYGGSLITNGDNAIGLLANGFNDGASGGAPGRITADLGDGAGLTLTTTGRYAHAVVAASGGGISLNGGSVTTFGAGAVGLLATGANSTVTATNVVVSTSGATNANAIYAENGGLVTASGGSASTSGRDSYVVGVADGGTVRLANVSLTGTGRGGGGVAVNGATAAFSGVGLTIGTKGGYDSLNAANGVYNASFGPYVGGGTVSLSQSTISTQGDFAAGAVNGDGGSLKLTGGSVATGGADAPGVLGRGSGTIQLAGVAVATAGVGAKGLDIQGAGVTLTGSGLNVATAGARDISGFSAGALYNGAGAYGAAGGSVTLTASTFQTRGDHATGVDTQAGGSTTLTGGSVATLGVQADAVYGASASKTALDGLTLTTGGNASKGIEILGTGTQLTGTGLTISTSGTIDPATGFHAHGVYNGSAEAPGPGTTGGGVVLLSKTSVTTGGADAYGVATVNGGSTQFSGGTITTKGERAVGLLAADAGTSVVVALDSAGKASTIATYGANANAVSALAGASVELSGARLSTTGDGASGLTLRDAATSVSAFDVVIGTGGGLDPVTGLHANAIYNGPGGGSAGGGSLQLTRVVATTGGDGVYTLLTAAGGATAVSGGTFVSQGRDALAVATFDTGTLQISAARLSTGGDGGVGLTLAGTGGRVEGAGLSISTAGGTSGVTGMHAAGVYNGTLGDRVGGGALTLADSSVVTLGAQAFGVFTGAGGTTTLKGGSVTTSGAGATGVLTGDQGTAALGPDDAGSRLSVVTKGVSAAGVLAYSGGAVAIYGADIATGGAGSAGLAVYDAQTSVIATQINVSTQSATDVLTGLTAHGVYNGPGPGGASGGALTLQAASVTTQGAGAAALVTGAGGRTSAALASFATSGAGSYGVWARDGGAVVLDQTEIATGGAGSHGVLATGGASVALNGPNTILVSGAGAAGVYASDGASVTSGPGFQISGSQAQKVNGPLTIRAGSDGVVLTGAASATLGATLALTTANGDGAALTLSGDKTSFSGTGGGTIVAAGKAVAFLNGDSQSASFVNYGIESLQGDLIFVDPATSTVNFTNTTANAGTGNLANVVNNSQLDLTADASALTGVVLTAPGSVSNVTLNNGSSWLISGNSNVTNLAINNSSATFSPDGGFKSLVTTNYTGANALITFNAALAGGGADQLVIDGGKASGSTTIAIHAVGSGGAPGSVPLVVTRNGGTLAPDAFSLAGPVFAGGYQYQLLQQNGGEYLVSSLALSPAQASGSLAGVAQARQTQAVTARVLGSILTGATEQINCASCASGFASFGSFAVGAHGRWTLNQNVSLLAGISYDNYTGRGVSVNNALLAAVSLRYDAVQLGKNRPFVEAGASVEPYASVTYRRSYLSTLGDSVGVGTALSRSGALYARAGYIWRLSRTDEAAAYTSLSRTYTWTSGYTESATVANPFGAAMLPTHDAMNIWSVGAQYTHLFGQHIEGNLSLGYARAFAARYAASAAINGFGDASALAPTGFDWVELGGRVSYRFSKAVVADAFVLGTLGAEPAGKQIHGGVALRMAF